MAASEHLNPAQFDVQHIHQNGKGTIHVFSDAGQSARQLGSMYYRMTPIGAKTHPVVDNVHVEPNARRQGVASAMYHSVLAEHKVPIVHVADELSSDGRRTVRALAKKEPENHRMMAFTTNGNMTSRKIR